MEDLARLYHVSEAPPNSNHAANSEHPPSAEQPPIVTAGAEFNDDNVNYEVYVHPTPPPPHAGIGRPNGLNRRISASPVAAVIVIEDDDDSSYTGSSDGFTENANIINLTPARQTAL